MTSTDSVILRDHGHYFMTSVLFAHCLKEFLLPCTLSLAPHSSACWHNGFQGHTMSSFKKMVGIKNHSKKSKRLFDIFLHFNLHETLISCSECGCRSSCWCNRETSSSSFGAGKGQEGLSLMLYLVLVACTVQLQK